MAKPKYNVPGDPFSGRRGPQSTKGELIKGDPFSRPPAAWQHVLQSHGQKVEALRQFLRTKGYALPAHGDHEGALMLSALKDWHSGAGKRNPNEWTQDYLSKRANAAVRHDPSSVLLPNGKRTADMKPAFVHAAQAHPVQFEHGQTAVQKAARAGAHPHAPHGNGGGNSVNPGPAMKAIKTAVGQKIPSNDANFGQDFNVDKTAEAMAQEQFQPQINEQQLILNRDPRQNAQNEADVKNWYDQVTDSQGKATAADAAATKQGVDATNQQTDAIVKSLGGSANLGSGEAAAAGQNASGTLQAIGASQQGLDQELAPILAAQAASQQQNQRNIDTQKTQNDQQALQDLQGQEGNAQTNAQMQLQSANNSLDQARQSALMNILQYNNSLGQQNFQNKLGLLTTQTAAAMNGVNMAKTAAEANYYNARGQYYAGGGGGSARSASQLNDIQKSLLGALGSKGLIISPSAGVYKLAPGVTPAQVQEFGKNFDAGYGTLPGSFLPSALSGIQGY